MPFVYFILHCTPLHVTIIISGEAGSTLPIYAVFIEDKIKALAG